MIYVLYPLSLLYCALGIHLITRYPDNLRARSLGFFALYSMAGAGGALIQGTAEREAVATFGAVLGIGVGMGVGAWALLLLVLGLFYADRLLDRGRRLLWAMLGCCAVTAVVGVALALRSPLLVRTNGLFQPRLDHPALQLSLALVLLTLPIALGLLLYRAWRTPADRPLALLLATALAIGFVVSGGIRGLVAPETQIVINASSFLPATLLIVWLLLQRKLFALTTVGIEQAANSASAAILVIDAEGVIRWCNQAVGQALDLPVADLIGGPFQSISDRLIPSDSTEREQLFRSTTASISPTLDCRDGRSLNIAVQPIARDSGEHEGWLLTITDVTARRRQEQALLSQNQRLRDLTHELRALLDEREALSATIRDLSVPVLPVLPGMLAVPLVGTFDGPRAQQLQRAVLTKIEQERARRVLLDLTGVPVIDPEVAQLMMQLTAAMRLLGAEAVLVGVQPAVAQTLVQLGISFAQLPIQNDLQSAVLQYSTRKLELSRRH